MIRQLILAALLHEAVHVNIPSVEYLKSGTFTAEQHRAIKVSYENGLRLVTSVPDLEYAATIIKYQHEHFDGTGLFDGLDGEKIPFCSRILAVANAYDEITSGMHPQLLCTDEEAGDWLRSRAGTVFDPAIVEDFLKLELGEGRSVRQATSETDAPTDRETMEIEEAEMEAEFC
jgi:response regulator RpfG family c-di-GMP phosphodiesterase